MMSSCFVARVSSMPCTGPCEKDVKCNVRYSHHSSCHGCLFPRPSLPFSLICQTWPCDPMATAGAATIPHDTDNNSLCFDSRCVKWLLLHYQKRVAISHAAHSTRSEHRCRIHLHHSFIPQVFLRWIRLTISKLSYGESSLVTFSLFRVVRFVNSRFRTNSISD
jgi:hypothetical protein